MGTTRTHRMLGLPVPPDCPTFTPPEEAPKPVAPTLEVLPMTMPSTPELPRSLTPTSPRGIWTVTHPVPGVYAELHGVTASGVRVCSMYARSEADLPAMREAILALLLQLDPLEPRRPSYLALASG